MLHLAFENILQRLPYSGEARFDSKHRERDPSCLPGTRNDVLREIRTWAEGQSDRNVFWLSGMAGTGKSTIARTVAREQHTKKQLGASFFFSKGSGDARNAHKFFTTIAAQMAEKSPALQCYIVEAVSRNVKIAKRALGEQWELLILRPLSMIRPEPSK